NFAILHTSILFYQSTTPSYLYPLSLHDALPISLRATVEWSHSLLSGAEQVLLRRLSVFAESFDLDAAEAVCGFGDVEVFDVAGRSEEHTSELQSREKLVCRLLLEKINA